MKKEVYIMSYYSHKSRRTRTISIKSTKIILEILKAI